MTDSDTNSLGELNSVLFQQLNRLNEAGLKGDALESEIQRSNALTSVSKEIVSNARTVLDAAKLKAEYRGLDANDAAGLPKL